MIKTFDSGNVPKAIETINERGKTNYRGRKDHDNYYDRPADFQKFNNYMDQLNEFYNSNEIKESERRHYQKFKN